MTFSLRPNEVVHSVNQNLPCKILELLGSGGQGDVFRGECGGSHVAVKWYNPAAATERQRNTIDELVQLGPPDQRFLWPIDLVTGRGIEGFGYIMPLRDNRFKGIPDLLRRTADPTFRALAIAGFHLADGYLKLHAKGRCYKDINWGNVFLDPKTGDILICDNDNVAIDSGEECGVGGTLGFMAPEVVRGEVLPSTQTDLFSLAVLLFYMFMIEHPFHGKLEANIRSFDAAAKYQLYGNKPVFVFDPNDDSNRPVPGYHDNAIEYWKVYPDFLKQLFINAFTNGVRDPDNGRVRESEWRKAMLRLLDSIFPCASCGAENFYDVANVQAGQNMGVCWSCSKPLLLPLRLKVGNQIVMLTRGTQLFQHHIDTTSGFDLTKVIGALVQHPTDPKIWGLTNLSQSKWTCTGSDGVIRDIEPTKSIRIQPNVKIQFGTADGEIR
ncbi:MAG: protein kinase [Planctomycetaceae bacterium]|nr:protein kinase [Planctomycetaceae bacterium]